MVDDLLARICVGWSLLGTYMLSLQWMVMRYNNQARLAWPKEAVVQCAVQHASWLAVK